MNILYYNETKTPFIQVCRKGNIFLYMRISTFNDLPDRILIKAKDIIEGTYFTIYESGEEIDELFHQHHRQLKMEI